MRPAFLLLLLSPLVLLSGCGEDEPALRIDVETFSFDGDLPAGLSLRHVQPGGGPQAVYALEPVPGGRAGEYRAPGAPDGHYVVEGPAGWWMLQEGGAPVRLVRGLQPPVVALGRGRSLYVGISEADARPSDVWGAVRILDDGREVPVPVSVDADESGYAVALRFAPEDWHSTLQAVGRMAEGPPPTPSPGSDAPLTQPIRFRATADGRPVVSRVQPEGAEPLYVLLVPASEAVSTEDLPVTASVAGLPIPSEVVAYARGGLARFASVPLVDRFLHLRVGDEPGVVRLDPVARRRQANVRLLALGDTSTRRVRIADRADTRIDEIQIRSEGAVAFGRVPFERDGDGVVLAAPAGEGRILLRSGDRWADVALTPGDDAEISAPAYRRGVVVGGRVDGATPDAVVRLFRQVGPDGEAVLGDGFEVRVEPVGTFEAYLPTGRYLVEVANRTGTWRRPAPLRAESPGARLHVPLESP